MQAQDFVVQQFEQNRSRLRGVAFRMLGSLSEADDAVQEAWLRLSRSDADGIENLVGWLTTVVSRVCLDMLRSRKSRREESIEAQPSAPAAPKADPEHEAVMADSVGVALLVVLDRLAPAERLAFVLHDLFGVSFEEIAKVLGRSEMATRQLASRARRRVQGGPIEAATQKEERAELVRRLIEALRAGDVQGMVAVLDPEFVLRVDEASMVPGGQREVHGAENWARQAVVFAKGARFVEPVLVDGVPGMLLAPHGRLMRALRFTFADGKIAGIEVIGEPARLRELELAVME